MRSTFNLLCPFLIFGIALPAHAQDGACAPITQNLTFASTDAQVQSPGVGFVKDLYDAHGNGAFHPERGNTWHESLGRLYVRLDRWKKGESLPPEFLNKLEKELAAARSGHRKVALRFVYNYPCENTDPSGGGLVTGARFVCPDDNKASPPVNNLDDASAETVIRHIGQLAPLFKRNSDVISVVNGFVGQWGEWHSSTNGLTVKEEDGRKEGELDHGVRSKQRSIVDSLLKAYPGPVPIRYLRDRDQITDASIPAYSRVGIHNDCFLSSRTDENSYIGDRSALIEAQKERVGQIGLTALNGGEICHFNQPDPPNNIPPHGTDCVSALRELRQMHFSFLGDDPPEKVRKSWENTHPPAPYPSAPNCFETIRTHLGYRFVLRSAQISGAPISGGTLSLRLRVANEGFASSSTPRPIYGIVECGSPPNVTRSTSYLADAKTWPPSSEASQQDFKIRLPVLPAGTDAARCKVSLRLPDGCDEDAHGTDLDEQARVKNCKISRLDPAYSVQLANSGNVWQANTGLNQLTDQLQITTGTASGCHSTPASSPVKNKGATQAE